MLCPLLIFLRVGRKCSQSGKAKVDVFVLIYSLFASVLLSAANG